MGRLPGGTRCHCEKKPCQSPCGRHRGTRLSAPLGRNNSPVLGQFAWFRKDLKSTKASLWCWPSYSPELQLTELMWDGLDNPSDRVPPPPCRNPQLCLGPDPKVHLEGSISRCPLRFRSSTSPPSSASVPLSCPGFTVEDKRTICHKTNPANNKRRF